MNICRPGTLTRLVNHARKTTCLQTDGNSKCALCSERGGKDALLTSICSVCVVWLFYCGKICINLKLPYIRRFKKDNKPYGARRWASLKAPHLEDDQQAQRFLGQNGIELSSGLGPDNAAAPATPDGSRLRHRLGKQTELLSETTVSTYGESNKALN